MTLVAYFHNCKDFDMCALLYHLSIILIWYAETGLRMATTHVEFQSPFQVDMHESRFRSSTFISMRMDGRQRRRLRNRRPYWKERLWQHG